MLDGKLHHIGIIVRDAEQVKLLADQLRLQTWWRQNVAVV